MKQLKLMKTLLVALGLCVGTSSAFASITTTYDFKKLSSAGSTLTTSGSTTCYAETHSYSFDIIADISPAVDGFPALNGILASYTGVGNNQGMWLHGTYGLYSPKSRYWAIRNLTKGAKVSFTYISGDSDPAHLYYYTRTSNGTAYIGTTKLTPGASGDTSGASNIASGDVVVIMSGEYLVIQPTKNARVTSMTVTLPESQAEIDAAVASTGNTTYSITSAPKGEEQVTSVYGITATFGGTSDETWTHALEQDNRGWINTGAATTSGNLPTGRTFMKFEPIIDGTLTINAYLFTSSTTFHAYLSDGKNIIEDKVFPKDGQEGSLGGNGTYSFSFTSTLQGGTTYYVYFSKQSSGGKESFTSGFWGFTFEPIPTHEIIGAFDKSTAASANVFGSDIVVANNSAKKLTFQNHGSSYGNNWILKFSHEGEEVTSVRADWYWKYEGDGGASKRKGSYTYGYTFSSDGGATADFGNVWANYATDMDDAEIVLNLSHIDGKVYVNGTMTKDARVYYFSYKYVDENLTEDVTFNLSVNNCWLEVKSVEDADASANPAAPAAVVAPIGNNGYATFCCIYPLDFTSVSDATAWVATACDGEKVTMNQVEGDIYQEKGLILKSATGTTANVTIPIVASSVNYYDTNKLVACLGETTVKKAATGTNYVLSVQDEEVVFAPIGNTNATVGARHCYLWWDGNSSARALSIDFSDEATGISSVRSEVKAVNGYYNLAGQRVAQPAKGLYIVNGKKVVIK